MVNYFFRFSVPALLILALVGCENKQMAGTAVGAGAGAAIGSLFGGGTGQVVAAGVGGVIGAVVGNQVGSSMDKADQANPPPPPQPSHQSTQPPPPQPSYQSTQPPPPQYSSENQPYRDNYPQGYNNQSNTSTYYPETFYY